MTLTKDEIVGFLDNPESWDKLFEQARQMRFDHFGNEVYAYGFDYFSTYCKNSCAFCLYRKENDLAPRYRHGARDIIRATELLERSGVHLVDLTMGEDPYYHQRVDEFVEIVEAVANSTDLPVMVSPGVMLEEETLYDLRDAGATWLALYQETFSRERFAQLRVGQDYDERMEAKRAASRAGLLVEDGILIGWGDSNSEVADSILRIGDANPSQVRVMTFVPQPGTPLAKTPAQSSVRELVVIALLRLVYPTLLVPASLDVEGPAGLRARLDAGANVITSIIPPGSGLEGVARNLDIEDGSRTLAQIKPTIAEAGLSLASHDSYERFIAREQERVKVALAEEVEQP